MTMTPKQAKEWRSDLRYAYRHNALNMFGKPVAKLTPGSIRVILDNIIKTYYPIRPYVGYVQIDKDEFMSTFGDIFKKEIRAMKAGTKK